MLWLAGLMGLMAVGAVAHVETGDEEADADGPETEAGDMSGTGLTVGDIISGTEGDDLLTGGTGDDQIGGYAGDDLIDGDTGNDDLHGAEGADTILGGADEDTLHGDDGDDDLYGGTGNDSIAGHNHDDFIWGEEGDDSLQGSAGDDCLHGGAGDDALQGGLDDDYLAGDAGEDALFGGWGDDTLSGVVAGPEGMDTDNGDYLNGGGGDDVIAAGNDDTVTAGTGVDSILLGDWIAQGQGAEILDYAPEEDHLLFVWDDSDPEALPPEVSILPDPASEGALEVWMDNAVVARVAGAEALETAEISLVRLSAAVGAGWVPG
jgi:Ca2+-binding RTX toxin-like protein